jgi:hypothetical protein
MVKFWQISLPLPMTEQQQDDFKTPGLTQAVFDSATVEGQPDVLGMAL